eukprot:gene3851-4236_t
MFVAVPKGEVARQFTTHLDAEAFAAFHSAFNARCRLPPPATYHLSYPTLSPITATPYHPPPTRQVKKEDADGRFRVYPSDPSALHLCHTLRVDPSVLYECPASGASLPDLLSVVYPSLPEEHILRPRLCALPACLKSHVCALMPPAAGAYARAASAAAAPSPSPRQKRTDPCPLPIPPRSCLGGRAPLTPTRRHTMTSIPEEMAEELIDDFLALPLDPGGLCTLQGWLAKGPRPHEIKSPPPDLHPVMLKAYLEERFRQWAQGGQVLSVSQIFAGWFPLVHPAHAAAALEAGLSVEEPEDPDRELVRLAVLSSLPGDLPPLPWEDPSLAASPSDESLDSRGQGGPGPGLLLGGQLDPLPSPEDLSAISGALDGLRLALQGDQSGLLPSPEARLYQSRDRYSDEAMPIQSHPDHQAPSAAPRPGPRDSHAGSESSPSAGSSARASARDVYGSPTWDPAAPDAGGQARPVGGSGDRKSIEELETELVAIRE